MQLNTDSSFVSYILTAGEIEAGSHFSTEQRAVIQNLIAETAEEKVSLTFDPNNPLKFTQAEAELQGKIGILKYLLSLETTLTE